MPKPCRGHFRFGFLFACTCHAVVGAGVQGGVYGRVGEQSGVGGYFDLGFCLICAEGSRRIFVSTWDESGVV